VEEAGGREDIHFHLDNVPPLELQLSIRAMSPEFGLSPDDIAQALSREYGFAMQRDHTYSLRRAYDLGIAEKARLAGKPAYRLTSRGAKLQSVMAVDSALGMELLHYLHYTSYGGRQSDRKCLWSYRRCCQLIWAASATLPTSQMAATIQAEMREAFPSLDWTGRIGARFDRAAAGRLNLWLRALQPSPLPHGEGPISRRRTERYELALLALDDLYRARGYRYGDPVLLDDAVVDQISAVFFLERECSRDLLHFAVRLSPVIKLADTLAGPSVNLLRTYTIDDL